MVAQLGLNNLYYYAFDYMLETMFLGCYLLLMLIFYLSKIDVSTSPELVTISSENNNKSVIFNNNIKYTNIQSAENWKGFSETIRQISNFNSEDKLSFYKWLAGIIDGDGNFDIRILNDKLVLKAIRIKLHNRDIRILTYIQNILHMGAVWFGTLLLCLKLSNSGNSLKLLIPSNSRKAISGPTNHWCKVTTQKMIER